LGSTAASQFCNFILPVVILRKLAAVNLKTAVEPRMDPDGPG
jgi:hypothetical protein